MLYKELSFQIVGSIIDVHSVLGPGLLERPYKNAMKCALIRRGFRVENEKRYQVFYDQDLVGEYAADLVVDHKVIIEVKVIRVLNDFHRAQLINYLKISRLKLGFLVNFQGCKASWERIVL